MSLVKTVRHILHVIKCKVLYENRVTPALYKFGCRLGLFRPSIIIYVDGGICSQMHQYLLGRYYAEQGFRVSYAIGWFARNGKDNNGIHSRFFEFPDLWPDLSFEVASSKLVTFYSRVFPVKRNGMHFPLQVEPPCYFHGYYFFDDEKAYGEIFRRYFTLENAVSTDKLSVVASWPGPKCAVHVRRGDLANMDDTFYGKVTVDYFRKAIRYVRERYQHVKIFFFSDDIESVEENLREYYDDLPHELVRGNRAFEDLNLMAHCDCFVASQGSAGKTAALMNGNGLLIISADPHDVVWTRRYGNTLVISQ